MTAFLFDGILDMNNTAPLFSIVVPAYDEERYLPRCLDAIHRSIAQLGEDVEIIVVDNESHDGTVAVAREHGARVVTETAKNLSCIRNRGAQAARGRYLVFVDADSYMSSAMLTEIRRVIDSGRYVGGGVLDVRPDRWSLGIFMHAVILGLAFLLFWRRLSVCLFYTTREAFEAVGGFNESLYAVEDIDFAHRLWRHGREKGLRYKNLITAHLVTSTRKFDEYGDWMAFRHPGKVFRALRNDRAAAHDFWYRRRR